jgi:Putative peptidoglycan binding domain
MPKTTTRARTLHLANPLLTGPDVEALQRLLAPYRPGPVDGEYGPLTAAAVERAKWALGYPLRHCDSSAGPRLVARLEGARLPPRFLVRRQARQAEAAQALTWRIKIVANARWGIANEPQIHYEQLRPIDGLRDPRKLPLHTDCSGFATLCYAWAGAPDPNGLDYSGQGWTGTLLEHMKPVPAGGLQPGDLVVFGPPPGHHVALVLEPGTDPLLCSHGEEQGPLRIRFSVESAYQPAPATWLSCLPAS